MIESDIPEGSVQSMRLAKSLSVLAIIFLLACTPGVSREEVANIVEAEVAKALLASREDLVGPPGQRGESGPRGPQGEQGLPGQAPNLESVLPYLKTERLEVVDSQGFVRVKIAGESDDELGTIEFLSGEGNRRLSLGVAKDDGNPTIFFWDASDNTRGNLSVGPDLGFTVMLIDPDGSSTVYSKIGFGFLDPGLQERATFEMTESDGFRISLYDENGNRRTLLGEGEFLLQETDGGRAVMLSQNVEGTGSLSFFDESDGVGLFLALNPRWSVMATRDDNSLIWLQDAEGNTLFQAP